MLREYELTIIARADLPESEVGKVQAKYEQFMTADGGEILKKDVWGTKKIAFPINKNYRGFYVNYDFVGNKEHIAEMERLLRLDEGVLRYMTVKLNDRVDIAKRKDELAKAAAALREMKEREMKEALEEREALN